MREREAIFFGDLQISYNRRVYRGLQDYARNQRAVRIALGEPSDARVVAASASTAAAIIGPGPMEQMFVDLPWRCPLILFSATFRRSGVWQVTSDDCAIGVLAAEYLIEQGFRSFAFYEPSNYYGECRLEGFAARLAQAGFSPGVFDHFASRPRERQLGRWLTSLPKPCGLFCANDSRAALILDACRLRNIRIPQEIGLIGVDNEDVIAESTTPTLTTVVPGTHEIGYRIGELLTAVLAGETRDPTTILIAPVEIIERASTGALAIDDELVAEAVRYIRSHVSQGLRVKDVLEEVSSSRKNLDLHFLRSLGRTAAAEIRRTQLDRAQQLLARSNLTMPQVAAKCGFSSARQLSQTIRQQLNTTPTAYRRQSQNSAH